MEPASKLRAISCLGNFNSKASTLRRVLGIIKVKVRVRFDELCWRLFGLPHVLPLVVSDIPMRLLGRLRVLRVLRDLRLVLQGGLCSNFASLDLLRLLIVIT